MTTTVTARRATARRDTMMTTMATGNDGDEGNDGDNNNDGNGEVDGVDGDGQR